MRQWVLRLSLPCLLLGLAGGVARSAEPTADDKMLKEVMERLLAVIHDPPKNVEWPPPYEVVTDEKVIAQVGEFNAFAEIVGKDEKTGLWKPYVRVTPKFLKVMVAGKQDRLGCILAHELSHILLGHVIPGGDKELKTPFAELATTRIQEAEADLNGGILAERAGFSAKGYEIYQALADNDAAAYSSFEGLKYDHPAPKDRIGAFDKKQALLWHAMSSYDTGVDFLGLEQYASAERCFQDVVARYPAAPEAWANLGYARLMQYCDGLEPADVKRFDVGHLLTGGFYLRPKSLEVQTRGVDEKMWKSAVAALQTALKLQPDLMMPKVSLGVAYLVAPDGKDVKKADQWLQPAAEAAVKDDKMDPMDRMTALVNAGVADLAAGRTEAALAKFTLANKLSGEVLAAQPDKRAKRPALASALEFNLAMAEEGSADKVKRLEALGYWQAYLQTATPSSNWWSVGYERYAALSKALGVAAKTPDELLAASAKIIPLRQATSVKLANGESIDLAEPIADVRKRLGAGVTIPVPETKLVRVCYPALGVEVLGSDRVDAIYLVGPKAPALPIKTTELGSKIFDVTVGMTKKDYDAVLGPIGYEFRELIERDVVYRYYPDMGFAIRFDKGQVAEVVLAVMPRAAPAQP